MSKEVVLLDAWGSMFGMRAWIALDEKGVKYERMVEDLSNKTPLLLQMNPIYKQIPVLIHNGKPISESAIIVQYIDEVWSDKAPLMPSHPYERAQARFWVDFIDKKVYPSFNKMWLSKGEEEREAGKQELICVFKQLQETLGDKAFYGGDTFGFVDICLITFYCWFYTFETYGNFEMEVECPKIVAWAKRCIQRETVSKILPDGKEVYNAVVEMKKERDSK